MLREECFHRFIDFEAVEIMGDLLSSLKEAVAFVLLDDVGHVDAA
jgi:hypothetical protein